MRLAVNKPQRHKLISLTPLIDVIFILLLFFMLTTQFQRQQATTLQTGSLSADVATPVDETATRLFVQSDNQVQVNQGDVVDSQSDAFLSLLVEAKETGTRLIVSFDDAVNVQQMTDVIDTVNRAGIDDSLLRLDL